MQKKFYRRFVNYSFIYKNSLNNARNTLLDFQGQTLLYRKHVTITGMFMRPVVPSVSLNDKSKLKILKVEYGQVIIFFITNSMSFRNIC